MAPKEKPNRGLLGRLWGGRGRGQSRDGRQRKKYYVLSIDGGGIRGKIPVHVLAEIERRTGRPIAESFDCIVGCSTGAIIGLGLTTPDKSNPAKPAYSPRDILRFYDELGRQVFPSSHYRALRQFFRHRYDGETLNRVIKSALGNATLADCLTDVIIPAYEPEKAEPFLMRRRASAQARGETEPNFRLVDVVRVATAAPTLFSPAEIHEVPPGESGDTRKKGKRHVGLDGGITMNNPAEQAIWEILSDHSPDDYEITVVSLGVGQENLSFSHEKMRKWGLFSWVSPRLNVPLIRMGINFQLRLANQRLKALLGDRFMRIDLPFDDPSVGPKECPSGEMDNARPANLRRLDAFGRKVVEAHEEQIAQICAMIERRFGPAPGKNADPALAADPGPGAGPRPGQGRKPAAERPRMDLPIFPTRGAAIPPAAIPPADKAGPEAEGRGSDGPAARLRDRAGGTLSFPRRIQLFLASGARLVAGRRSLDRARRRGPAIIGTAARPGPADRASRMPPPANDTGGPVPARPVRSKPPARRTGRDAANTPRRP